MIIEDKLLKPYFIEVDKDQYILKKKVKVKDKDTGELLGYFGSGGYYKTKFKYQLGLGSDGKVYWRKVE